MQQLLHETTAAAGDHAAGAPATNVDGLKARHCSSDRTLRIATEKLDKMLDLTGEIAVARGHVRQLAAQDERVLDAVRELDRLSSICRAGDERAARSARPALRPFQRIVRDVARCGRNR